MERRTFILNSALAGVVALVSPRWSFAAPVGADSGPVSYKNPDILKKLAVVQESMKDCIKKGGICEKHCKDQISAGNTHFEKCLFNVQQMMALCEGTEKLAAIRSPLLAPTLDSCITSLRSCQEACLEHKAHFVHGMHLECKACAEACATCLNACTDLKKSLPHV